MWPYVVANIGPTDNCAGGDSKYSRWWRVKKIPSVGYTGWAASVTPSYPRQLTPTHAIFLGAAQ